jgi:hypothetical protein
MIYTNRQIVSALTGVGVLTDRLVASAAFTTLVLLAPVLTLARRWVLPPGAATLVFAAVAGLSGAVRGFANASTVAGLVAAGVVADLLLQALRPTGDRTARYRTFAGLVALVTWAVYITVAAVTAGPAPAVPGGGHPEGVVELYTGIPLVQAGLAVLLAVLLVPGRTGVTERS